MKNQLKLPLSCTTTIEMHLRFEITYFCIEGCVRFVQADKSVNKVLKLLLKYRTQRIQVAKFVAQ